MARKRPQARFNRDVLESHDILTLARRVETFDPRHYLDQQALDEAQQAQVRWPFLAGLSQSVKEGS